MAALPPKGMQKLMHVGRKTRARVAMSSLDPVPKMVEHNGRTVDRRLVVHTDPPESRMNNPGGQQPPFAHWGRVVSPEFPLPYVASVNKSE